MGSSQSCVDCSRKVPKKVKCFHWVLFRSDGRANDLYNFVSSNTWIKLGDSGYLCPYCLDKRVENEKREEENRRRREREQRAAEEARQWKEQRRREKEEQRKRGEQRRRQEEEQQRKREAQRQEEQRQKEQRQKEEQRKREEEQNKRKEEEHRRKKEEEKRKRKEQRRTEQIRGKKEENEETESPIKTVTEKDTILNSWIMKEKMTNRLEHSYIAHQTKTFDANTNPSNTVSDFLPVPPNEVQNTDDGDDVIKGRSQWASMPFTRRTQLDSKASNKGKSVEDITKEIENLCESDALKIEMVVRSIVSNLKPSSYWRIPDPLVLHNCILKKGYSHPLIDTCIAAICREVNSTQGYWPRNTQLVSLCLLIKSFQEGRLLEIKTGEGKSCIIAMFAVFLAMSGRSVDIVTSSPILAARDCERWRTFYKKFEIVVDCNLIPKENEDRLECYKRTVVYGTVGSFASDILRQEFLMEDVRGDRKFDAVIVDEVDSMLLDQGINFTYLSSPAPGMHHIQPILLMIWNEVIRHPVVQSDLRQYFFVGKPEPFHVVLSKERDFGNPLDFLFDLESDGVLRKGFTKDVQEEVRVDQNEKSLFQNEMTKQKMLQCLQWVESNFAISIEMFEMHHESTIHNVNESQIGKPAHLQLLVVGEGLVCVLYQDKKTLCELIKTKIERILGLITGRQKEEECRYEFPSYLTKFTRNRLPQWITNAFLALSMREGREYIIKDQQEIVPVDFESTGVVEVNTKWGDGLHQFLELKHQKKLSQMTLVTNFMSNQAFFKRYQGKLFGLSGTLGIESELAFLKKHYGLSYLRIPTYLKKRFSEKPGILCSNKYEWLKCIQKEVEKHTSLPRKKGAVLIICEDINTAKEMEDLLTTQKAGSITMFTENEEKDKFEEKQFAGGDVIIATNIAGRGTDIEIHESVVSTGGLFVLVTFLPSNMRVENQVFGRCARKGQPGSARLVINKECLPLYLKNKPFIDILKIKRIREENAELRQKDNEEALSDSTIPKENLFYSYCRFIKNTDKELKDASESERKILLNSMHELWGLWLKMNCEDLNKDAFKELEQRLKKDLHNAKRQVMNKTSPCANLYHIIKFANERLIKEEFEEAQNLYTEAIETDKTWAAVAYYNRAYCSLLQRKDRYTEAISDLKKAKEGFLKFREEVILSISLLSILPKDTKSADESASTSKSQLETRGQILNFYEENIDETLKKLSKLEEANKYATAKGRHALTIALGDDKFCKKLDSELHVFCDLGLTDVVSIEEKCAFNWKAALVVLIGVLQITVGGFAVACSSGLLPAVGWSLVTKGINDFWTGTLALFKGDQDFFKSWAIRKAASIAISIATFGFGEVISALEETNGFKAAFKYVEEKIQTAGKKMWTAMKETPEIIPSKSFPAVMANTSKEVAVHVSKETLKRGSKHVLESVNKHLKTNFEDETRMLLNKELNKAMEPKGELQASLDKFIVYKIDKINVYKIDKKKKRKYLMTL